MVSDFNSIKVQLKPFVSNKCDCFTPFQFHKGTIKTKPKMLREPSAVKFQFHKGTIKALERTGGLFKHCISIP